MSQFADEVGGRALTTKNCHTSQKDLDKIIQLPDKWQMLFNFEEGKVKHLGAGTAI